MSARRINKANTAKCFGAILLASILWNAACDALDMPFAVRIIVGGLLGWFGMQWAMNRWPVTRSEA